MKNRAIQYSILIGLILLTAGQARADEMSLMNISRNVIGQLRDKREEFRQETVATKKAQLTQILTTLSRYMGNDEKLQTISHAASSAKNINELRHAANEIKKIRQESNSFKARKTNILNQVTVFENQILAKANARVEKMEQGITALKNNGKDVTKLKTMLADVRGDLQTIRTNLEKLTSDVQNATSAAALKNINAQKILQSARQDMVDVYEAFSDIIPIAQKL